MIKLLFSLLSLTFLRCEHYAVLTAGSSGIYNYRHQADICHAYQVYYNFNKFPFYKEI